MHYLKSTKDDVLTLKTDGTRIIKWHVDALFAMIADYMTKPLTGEKFKMFRKSIMNIV